MLSAPPTWALALTYWLHMLATVAWLGSLASLAILVLPAAKKSLKPVDQLAFMEAMQRRIEPIAWFSMSLLVLTGLFQMSVNPHYDGFLAISGQWSLAILIKHFFGLLMVIVSAVQTWEVLPAIRRGLMRLEKGKLDKDEISRLQKRERILIRLNIVLSIFILAATAFARAS
jgi:uncharacterized membrane protein